MISRTLEFRYRRGVVSIDETREATDIAPDQNVTFAWRWIRMFKTRILAALVLLGLSGMVQAADYDNYMHWPYVPPQVPGAGANYQQLYDGWYLYPREQRIVPQIQGPLYRNYYGGKKDGWWFGRKDNEHRDWSNKKWYKGYHFYLDVF
jgi:hypothetical protein